MRGSQSWVCSVPARRTEQAQEREDKNASESCRQEGIAPWAQDNERVRLVPWINMEVLRRAVILAPRLLGSVASDVAPQVWGYVGGYVGGAGGLDAGVGAGASVLLGAGVSAVSSAAGVQ